MPHPAWILLVEDNPGHVSLICRNLQRTGVTATIDVVGDGNDALAYLETRLPEVVILDLNLPRLSGFDLLVSLKSTAKTSHIPVIVLSSTENDDEVKRCYACGCNMYLLKPVDYADFTHTIELLGAILKTIVV